MKKILLLVFFLFVLTGCETTQYVVVYQTNGGTMIEPETIGAQEMYELPNPPIKEGHTFDGWYTDSSLETIFNEETDLQPTTILYAKWIVNTYTLTLIIGEETDTYSIPYHQDLRTWVIPWEEDWGDFMGWNPAFPDYMPADDVTLIAQFQTNPEDLFVAVGDFIVLTNQDYLSNTIISEDYVIITKYEEGTEPIQQITIYDRNLDDYYHISHEFLRDNYKELELHLIEDQLIVYQEEYETDEGKIYIFNLVNGEMERELSTIYGYAVYEKYIATAINDEVNGMEVRIYKTNSPSYLRVIDDIDFHGYHSIQTHGEYLIFGSQGNDTSGEQLYIYKYTDDMYERVISYMDSDTLRRNRWKVEGDMIEIVTTENADWYLAASGIAQYYKLSDSSFNRTISDIGITETHFWGDYIINADWTTGMIPRIDTIQIYHMTDTQYYRECSFDEILSYHISGGYIIIESLDIADQLITIEVYAVEDETYRRTIVRDYDNTSTTIRLTYASEEFYIIGYETDSLGLDSIQIYRYNDENYVQEITIPHHVLSEYNMIDFTIYDNYLFLLRDTSILYAYDLLDQDYEAVLYGNSIYFDDLIVQNEGIFVIARDLSYGTRYHLVQLVENE